MVSRKSKRYIIATGFIASAIAAGIISWSSRKSKEVRTEIEINASDEQVWRILTDFKNFPKWNPFIPKISGQLKKDVRLKVRIQPPGDKGMTFRPLIVDVNPKRELRWIGRFVVPGLLSGEHIFMIQPLEGNNVRFVHREIFTGLFVLLDAGNFETNIRLGFEKMNQALKAQAELESSYNSTY